MIEERIAELKAFDAVRFAQKACSNLAILDLMHKQGVVVDAVSAGEIHRALKVGFVAIPPPAVARSRSAPGSSSPPTSSTARPSTWSSSTTSPSTAARPT